MNPDEDTIELKITETPDGDVTIDIRTNIDIVPNRLNEYYDALLLIHDNLPEETHPLWKIAIESVAIGGEGLAPRVTDYARQQINKNDHTGWEYRYQFGKADDDIDFPHLAEFQNIPTKTPRPEDQSLFDTEIEIPVAPKSKKVLPLKVDEGEISDAISLLNEFPTEPLNSSSGGTESNLLDAKMFPGLSSSISDYMSFSNKEKKDTSKHSQGSRDPKVERAHRQAQQRDPSDVVELGEVTTLVIKEADYTSKPPTIMGTKNKLVVWVKDAPRNLSKHDTIKVKIADYGGKNNSAESVFIARLE